MLVWGWQEPPTLLAEWSCELGDVFTTTGLSKIAAQPSSSNEYSTLHCLFPWPPPCILTKRVHGLFWGWFFWGGQGRVGMGRMLSFKSYGRATVRKEPFGKSWPKGSFAGRVGRSLRTEC